MGWLIAWRGQAKHYWSHHNYDSIGRQATGATQGNNSQALARRGVVGSRGESSEQWWKENQMAARELGLQLHSTKVSSADKFEEAFREMAKAHVAALSVSPGSVNTASPKPIIDLATKYQLPAVYDRTEFVTAGGLMSYGPTGTNHIGERPFLLIEF